MAYGARVVLKSASGERIVPLDEFFLGPGRTSMGPEEVLSEVLLERPASCYGAAYVKLGVRRTLEISIVNAAAFIALDSPDGRINEARIVLGAVAPFPMRALSAEKLLIGEKPSEDLFARAAREAAGDSRPIDDFRGSAEYRRDMVEVLARRTMNTALARAKECR
jgi:carbon-monoxide dehydrogenase medium subunit